MNISEVQDYMVKMNKEKFDGLIQLSKTEFRPSKDDGIIIDLSQGRHTLRIGRKISKHQMNRALILMLIDTVMDIKEESERKSLGDQSYGEYGGKVSQLQEQFFPSTEVFVEREGRIVKDNVIDCDAIMCNLRNAGSVNKDEILGLKYREVTLKNK